VLTHGLSAVAGLLNFLALHDFSGIVPAG